MFMSSLKHCFYVCVISFSGWGRLLFHYFVYNVCHYLFSLPLGVMDGYYSFLRLFLCIFFIIY